MKPPSWRTEKIGLASPMEEHEAAAQQEKGQRDEPDLRQSGNRDGLAEIVAGVGIGDIGAAGRPSGAAFLRAPGGLRGPSYYAQ